MQPCSAEIREVLNVVVLLNFDPLKTSYHMTSLLFSG